MTAAAYHQWRARFPWSDEEFGAAFDAEAAHHAARPFLVQRYQKLAALVRAGHLMTFMLRIALPRLITRCGVCGGKALYRVGLVGLCREHKQVVPAEIAAYRARRDHICAQIGADRLAFDKADLRYRAHKKAKRKGTAPSARQ